MTPNVVFLPSDALREDFPVARFRTSKEKDLARWQSYRKSLDHESSAFLYVKFFENFCDQQNFRIPIIQNPAGGRDFHKEVSLNDLAPEQLLELINPKRIKSDFLKKIGVDFRVDDSKKLIVDTKLVSELVEFFGRLEPLKFELNKADQKIFKGSPRYWVEKASGKVVRFTSAYEEEGDRGPTKEPSITIINDLASCLRGRFLERLSSEAEIEKAIPIGTEAGILSTQFWNLPTIRSNQGQELLLSSSELAEAAITFMRAPKVPEKRKAKKAIADRELDANPPARALQYSGAHSNLDKRVRAVNSISAFNEQDILHLRTTYLKVKQIFESALRKAGKISLGSIEPTKYAFFNSKDSTVQKLKQLDNFLVSLALTPELLERLYFKPFKTFADTILDWRKQTQKMIESGDFSAAKQQMYDLSGHIKAAASVHVDYLIARDVLNGENPAIEGKDRMLIYILSLKQLFEPRVQSGGMEQRYLSSKQERVTEFLAQADKVENKLKLLGPSAVLTLVKNIIELSGQSDLKQDQIAEFLTQLQEVEKKLKRLKPSKESKLVEKLIDLTKPVASSKEQGEEFIFKLREFERELLLLEPAKKLKVANYLKKLSGQVDIEAFLSNLLQEAVLK